MRKVRESLADNFYQSDPEFISLREELERIFKKRQLSEVSQEQMQENMGVLEQIYSKIKELNRQNDLLRHKYAGDAKFARLHKRLMSDNAFGGEKLKIFDALMGVKADADKKVLNLSQILDNESYFEKQMQGSVLQRFRKEQQFDVNSQTLKHINHLLVQEYLRETGRVY